MLRNIIWLAVCLQLAAAQCNSSNCKPPNCQCMGTSAPGGLSPADTPQFVFLTFDDSITANNYPNYTYILKGRTNPNGCPISMTFYVDHKANDYAYTHDLFYLGNEMASKSISAKTPVDLWGNMTTADSVLEIGGMREMLNYYANIPASSVKGYRAPFLQTNGDETFKALQQLGMSYDHSFPTTSTNPAIWPYTLDYGFPQDCQVGNCPSGSYPGFWMVPMVMLNGTDGSPCALANACANPGSANNVFNFLKANFERSYNGNRSPVGIYLHSAWFQGWPYTLAGYTQFLDYLKTFQDVYVVSVAKGLSWMQNPVPLANIKTSSAVSCPTVTPSTCTPRNCYYVDEDGNDILMRSCTACPDNYPWVGNTKGM